MSRDYTHLHRAHKCRACADLLERERLESLGDRELDIEIAAAREVAVLLLRERADALESGKFTS